MALPEVVLWRDAPTEGMIATFGQLVTPSGLQLYTLERLPSGDHPCIPAGSYKCVRKPHEIQGLRYELQNVPGRTAILIHPANFVPQLQGCISLGRAIMDLDLSADLANKYGLKPGKMMGVSSSRDAVSAFELDMEGEDFTLTIKCAG